MKKLLRFMRPHRWLLMGAILCVVINNFTVLYLPNIVSQVIDDGALSGDAGQIYRLGLRMLLVAVVGGIAYLLSVTLASKAISRFARDVRRAAFVKVQDYSLDDMQKFGTSSLVIRCTNDIAVIQRSALMVILQMLPAPIMAIVGIAMGIQTEPMMGLLMAVIIAAVFLIAYGIGSRAVPLFRRLQVKMDNMTRILREVFTGVRVIRAFNRQQYENRRFGTAATEYWDISVRTGKVFAILLPTLTLLTNLGIVVILWFGGVETSRGTMEIGQIFALIEYLTVILFTGIMAILVYIELPRASSCAQRINEVLEYTPEIQDRASAALPAANLRAHLEFRHVTFRYPGAEEAVLSDLSFTSKAGETTAIIGGTGSGKSTVANLIPRFFEIQEGEILIDGINIQDYAQKQLRDKIGFVPQRAFLFRGTIADNIRYGKEDATDGEVEYAATVAQAHAFISEKPEQYQSFVAQGGTNLSGGQRQRVAIARALVRKPEIYVFDDSFSALDFKTDAMLRAALRKEVKDATVVIVAQRVSTIMDADRIIVLDNGRAVGVGTHQELMKNCPVYQQIAASQLSESEFAGGGES